MLDGSYSVYRTSDFTGTTGSTVSPDTIGISGFEAPAKQQLIIDGSGESSLTYDYRRKAYSLTIEAGTGIERVIAKEEYLFEEDVNIGFEYEKGYSDAVIEGDYNTASFKSTNEYFGRTQPLKFLTSMMTVKNRDQIEFSC